MARVLVTGGTGFVGSALVRRLVAAGDEVLVLRRPEGDPWRLAAVAKAVHTCLADFGEPAAWREAVRAFAPQRVFHCAWYAEPGKYLTDEPANRACLAGSIAFVHEVLRLRPAQVVTVGTCFEYDTDAPAPLREDHTPERPQHVYSRCKLELKQAALDLGAAAGVPVVHARVFYLHGPFEDGRRLVPFVAGRLRAGEPVQLRSHGRQVRDFLHVDDVAQGIDLAAGLGRPGVVNIASGHGLPVRELTGQIADRFGRRDLLGFAADDTPLAEPMVVVGDGARLRGLGFLPRHWPVVGTFDPGTG
jgi:nucleoside-diphosphate-sugar epimerase